MASQEVAKLQAPTAVMEMITAPSQHDLQLSSLTFHPSESIIHQCALLSRHALLVYRNGKQHSRRSSHEPSGKSTSSRANTCRRVSRVPAAMWRIME